MIMAKYDLKFIDFFFDEDHIQVHQGGNLIWISGIHNHAITTDEEEREVSVEFTIVLDKSTAIKFAKTLRTEINKINDI